MILRQLMIPSPPTMVLISNVFNLVIYTPCP